MQIHILKRKMQICEALKNAYLILGLKSRKIDQNRQKWVSKKTTHFFEGLNSKTKTQKSCLPSIGRYCMFQFFNLGPKQRVLFFFDIFHNFFTLSDCVQKSSQKITNSCSIHGATQFFRLTMHRAIMPTLFSPFQCYLVLFLNQKVSKNVKNSQFFRIFVMRLSEENNCWRSKYFDLVDTMLFF